MGGRGTRLLQDGSLVPFFGGGARTYPVSSRNNLDNDFSFEPTYALTGLLPGYSADLLSGATGTTNLPNVRNGDYIITEAVASALPNRTIKDLKLNGRLIIQAANVIAINCWIRGSATPRRTGVNPPADDALVDCRSALCSNFTIKDSLLVPQTPTYDWNQVVGHDYKAIRCYGKWVVDNFRVYNNSSTAMWSAPTNVIVQSCFGEEGSYFYNDPNHTNDNRVHSDWIQIEGGSGTQLLGNKLIGRHAGWQSNYDPALAIPGAQTAPSPLWPGAVYLNTSGTDEGSAAWNVFAPGTSLPAGNPYGRFGWSMMTSLIQCIPNIGTISNLIIDGNYCYAGATQINFDNGGARPPAASPQTFIATVRNNKFHRSGGQPNRNIGVGNRYTISSSNNTYMDNGSPANVYTQS